jgi:hypothetical protein
MGSLFIRLWDKPFGEIDVQLFGVPVNPHQERLNRRNQDFTSRTINLEDVVGRSRKHSGHATEHTLLLINNFQPL